MTYSTSTNRISAVGGAAVSHDAAGNLLSDAGAPACSFTWNAENRLQTVSGCATLEFTYNALGQRVETKIGATNPVYRTVLYDGLGQVIAWHNRTTYTNLFLPLGGQTFATYEASQTFFLHSNHLGSTTFVTDHAGTVTQKSVFYPFGQLAAMSGTMRDERFASLNERDAETTLDPTLFLTHHARLYRWLSPDPLAGDISDPQSLNRYAYVLNNPINFIDPLGLSCESSHNSQECRNERAGNVPPPATGSPYGLGDVAACSLDGAPVPCNMLLSMINAGFIQGADSARIVNGVLILEGVWHRPAIEGDPACSGVWSTVTNLGPGWWSTFFDDLFSWQSAKQAQKEAVEKGYYSCIGNEMFPYAGLAAAGIAKGAEVFALEAADAGAEKAAGASYHFTDKRFTAWGKHSKVLVPRRAAKFRKALSLAKFGGMLFTNLELGHAIHSCAPRLGD